MTPHPSNRPDAAASDEFAAAIRALIAAGADVNAKDESGRTPLHAAALNGYADAVKALIAAGADINAKDERGQTPLHLAAEMGHAKTAKALAGDCEGSKPPAPPADGFWVYENYPTNRARVHRGDCKFCNHGEGKGRGIRNPNNGRWHGPFDTVEAACDKMCCLDKKDSGGCGFCKPCQART